MDDKKRIPAIRFKGFTDSWEQRKLGDLGEIMTGSTPSTSNIEYYSSDGLPWITPTDITALTIASSPRKLSAAGLKVARVVPANTILCTCIASIGKNALLTTAGSFNQQINSLSPTDANDPYFLLTESILWSEAMKRMAASGTMQIVNKTEFSELLTMTPKLNEQKVIGTFFKKIDNLITLHQRKLESLKKMKKALLEKMFPRDGENKPSIRFKGFTDSWEQRKLGDCGKTYTGLSNKKAEDFGHGSASFITYMNVFSNSIVNTKMVEHVEIDSRQNEVEIGDVFFTTSSETPEEVGMSCVLQEKQGITYLNSFCFGYRPTMKFDLNYLAYMLRSEAVRDQIKLLAQGISRYNISKAKVMDIKIQIPCLQEQELIGRQFYLIDNLITLHQRKLEKLKNIKKVMLEKMFV